MNRYLLLSTIIPLAFLAGTIQAQDSLITELEPLRPFIGKTWKGEFVNSTPDKPVYDVARWERALNGTAIRVLHSVNNGEYGGETIIFWDAKKESIAYYYFTTAGFYTNGTMRLEGNRLISHEYVTGNENGITEVKAIGTLLSDGRMKSESIYLKGDIWIDGHAAVYREEPEAEIIFR